MNCESLNIVFSADSLARGNAFFSQGTTPIVFDDVACSGSEQRLIDCPYTSLHNCDHSEDAGVECSLTSGSF